MKFYTSVLNYRKCETIPKTNTKEENDKQANKQEESSQFVG